MVLSTFFFSSSWRIVCVFPTPIIFTILPSLPPTFLKLPFCHPAPTMKLFLSQSLFQFFSLSYASHLTTKSSPIQSPLIEGMTRGCGKTRQPSLISYFIIEDKIYFISYFIIQDKIHSISYDAYNKVSWRFWKMIKKKKLIKKYRY